jgi:hypothetical protein
MRVGFAFKYGGNEETLIATRLAAMAQSLGNHVSFYSSVRPSKLTHPCIQPADLDFPSWCKDQGLVVWTAPPLRHIVQAAKQAKVRTVLVFSWTGLDQPGLTRASCYLVDYLIAPTAAAFQFLTKTWHIAHTRYIPWDSGAPITRRISSEPPQQVTIYSPTARDLLTSLWLAGELGQRYQALQLTCLYGPGRVLPSIREDIKRWHRYFAGRLQIRPRSVLHPIGLRALMTQSDLTIMHHTCDGLGEFCLEALTAGSPLVCYDVPVLSEYAKDGYNALLSACELVNGPAGIPVAVNMPDGLLQAACWLLDDDQARFRLSCCCDHGLLVRRRQFEQGWSQIFGVSGG